MVIVDDVQELRAVLRQALRLRGGFEVVGECANGAEAIAAARSHQPDIVVLDLGLRDLAGHEVLTGLRGAAPDARIVVYTGSHMADLPALAGSVDAFFEKSQDIAYLVDLLADMGGRAGRTAMLRLDRDAADIALARRFVTGRCVAWGFPGLAAEAELVATELVTNAMLHARTGCEVRLGLAGSALRIEVVDFGGGVPDLRAAGARDGGGRGLLLVSVLSAAWGAETTAEGGKRVWAELSTDGTATVGPAGPASLVMVDVATPAHEHPDGPGHLNGKGSLTPG